MTNITIAFNEFKNLKHRCHVAQIEFNLTLQEFIDWYSDNGANINDSPENMNRTWEMARKDETLSFVIDNLEAKPKKKLVPITRIQNLNTSDYINPPTTIDSSKPALVIGNGRSRLQINLNSLKHKFNTFGCNAIYRDFTPDVIISLDRGIVDELITNQVYLESQMYTRYNDRILHQIVTEDLPIRLITFPGQYLDSGNSSVYIASQLVDRVFMIGFDYITSDGTLNNVYAGTSNYSSGRHIEQYLIEKWHSRLESILTLYPDTQFYRVVLNNYYTEINKHNFKEITLEEFEELNK